MLNKNNSSCDGLHRGFDLERDGKFNSVVSAKLTAS